MTTILHKIAEDVEDPKSELSKNLFVAYLTSLVAKTKRYQAEQDSNAANLDRQVDIGTTIVDKLSRPGMWTAPEKDTGPMPYAQRQEYYEKFTSFWDVFNQKEASGVRVRAGINILQHNHMDTILDTIAPYRSDFRSPSDIANKVSKGQALKKWGDSIREVVVRQLNARQGGRNSTSTTVSPRTSYSQLRNDFIVGSTSKPGVRQACLDVLQLEGQNGEGELKDNMGQMIRAFAANPIVVFEFPLTFMLMGPPGVGKTTFGKKIGALIAACGFLMEGNFVEANRSNFVGQYLGETDKKTQAFLTKNTENIIFLDEAYALTTYKNDGGERQLDSYGEEAVNTLVYWLTELKGRICFLAAGYEEPMKRDFLGANIGMGRRFKYKIVMKNYDAQTLTKIYKHFIERFVPVALITKDSYVLLEKIIQIFESPDVLRQLVDEATMVAGKEVVVDRVRKDADYVYINQALAKGYIGDPNDDLSSDHALELLYDRAVENLMKLFYEQAGAMEQLANTAGMYLLGQSAEKCKGKLKGCYDKCTMMKIVVLYAKESVPDAYDYIEGDGEITIGAALMNELRLACERIDMQVTLANEP